MNETGGRENIVGVNISVSIWPTKKALGLECRMNRDAPMCDL